MNFIETIVNRSGDCRLDISVHFITTLWHFWRLPDFLSLSNIRIDRFNDLSGNAKEHSDIEISFRNRVRVLIKSGRVDSFGTDAETQRESPRDK